ncbi:MAG TPA: nucleoside diphosphate kinase regulator [Thermoanaerobaculia bacterium]|nr:nucleoside diphosphate kinase regulator [Thermoanaerobaculia bacterium]
MAERQIYITTEDKKRLEFIGRMAGDARDRGDLLDLVDELNRAQVVAPEEVPPDVVTMNSKVRLVDLDQGTTHEYTLVYPQDADFSAGRISIVAPIGAALLGYRMGDVIEWEVPAGRRRLRVEEVLFQPEAAGRFDL